MPVSAVAGTQHRLSWSQMSKARLVVALGGVEDRAYATTSRLQTTYCYIRHRQRQWVGFQGDVKREYVFVQKMLRLPEIGLSQTE